MTTSTSTAVVGAAVAPATLGTPHAPPSSLPSYGAAITLGQMLRHHARMGHTVAAASAATTAPGNWGGVEEGEAAGVERCEGMRP
uniref:Uncharacterized protein n=1 Tax=Oryza punctata TaxID=4537 RepID=A0A0E0JMY0_ORYPU